MYAAFQPGVVLDVMTLYLGNKFLLRNDTDLLKMWKMSDVGRLWDVHFYIEQRDEVPLGIVDPIDLDTIPKVLLIDSDDDSSIEEIATQVEPIVEPIVSHIQAQRLKKLVTKPRLKKKKTLLKLVDEEDVEKVQVQVQVPERVQDQEQVYKGKRKKKSTTRSEPKTKKTRPSELLEEALDELPPLYFSDDEVIVENTDVGGNTVGEGVEDMGGNTVDGEHRGGVGDMGVNTDNWTELDPDNLNAEEGYYSTHTSQDDLAKEYDNIFAEEEDAVHSVPPQPTYGELRVGMEWATVYECRAYIRQWSIMNKFEYYQEKNKNYRIRLFCIDENCEWMFYARRTIDGHTFTLRKNSNLKHTCSSRAKNRLANASWVAKQVESMMRSVRTTIPVGIQDLISTQFGVDISYYTAWNAWSIYKEKIVGSYDEGYIMQPELCLQILYLNPGSIAVVSKDHDTSQWTGTCVMFKASIDGFLNGSRPVIMHPYFVLHNTKLTFISDRQKGLIDTVADIFPFANHRFCFRHMYKNMKKVYRGTHLESLVWKPVRAYKKVEKKNLLDELKLDNPSAHDWLMKGPFEHWDRSHFDFTAKCEYITNNFFESLNNWILKIRDKPLHKALEKLNLMLMKLMFDRRQKAKDWEEKCLVLVPRAQTHIDKLKRQYGQYRIEGTKKGDGNTGQVSGQRWRVNLGTHECDCHEWQVTGLLCVHVVFVIVPYRYSWANFVSEYHIVSSYVKTYKDVIYPVVNPSEWGQPQPPYFVLPPLVRGPGRPRKERIHDPDEKMPHKRCGTCGCFGHNKTTCKGPPVVPIPRVVRTRQRQDTNTSRTNFMINIGLQVDAGGERYTGRTESEGRTGRNTVGGRTSARGGGDRGKTRGRGSTGRNIVRGRTGARGGGDRGKTRSGGRTGRNTVGGRTG
ncbi:hypothetical protein GIB67_013012 [Kingdonia uniflora]|uniref:SWIM-type domain-containing protein n=1 Tax=Kingdonia uniflora TaxID=39325 RepID=A0A7J7MCD9_9MAGN|nr:hypothetical protein GIB67_013012 [Kingdonia uniflora]